MNAYEFQVLFGAVNYLSMFPTLVAIPYMWSIVLFNVGLDAFNEENTKSMQAVFLMLLIVIVPAYVATLMYKYTSYIAVSAVQRIVLVFSCALVTGLIGQDAFPGKQFVATMFVVDVGGGFAHAFAHPNGISGCFKDCWQLTKNTPTTPFNKALRVESYVGMVFGFMAIVYAAVVANVKCGIIIVMVATFVVFIWTGFHANDPSETPTKILIAHRLLIVASLCYLSEVQDFNVLNDVFRAMSVSMIGAIVSPYLGAIVSGVSTLYFYKLGCDYIMAQEEGSSLPLIWMGLWGVVTVVLSYGWVFLFYDEYDDKQKKRVMGTNWQDRILGFFCFVSGAALAKAGHFSPGTVGEPVIYLLPPITIWFTLETKMLNHMQVGTPFHPSWWMEGDLPRFSKTDWVNATFGIATALITVVLTSYAMYAVWVAMGPESYSFNFSSEDHAWKFAFMHGMTFIFHSGFWMIFASSGVPPIGDGKAFRAFPPEIPTPMPCRPHDCIPVHKRDLLMGNALLFLGFTSILDGGEYDLYLKAVVAIFWTISILSKVKTHYDGWGYKYTGDPDPNGTVTPKNKKE
eukprot:CAMPEP_0198137314 /NCGR_PEP_ID=MMETSP1443-20131203/836_1 /TAXON_ID=186043 /ORGANISM="Entomoneis sp., Strain CCMP2396" /LENGTH=570 /DNA_ID=CAMNT_0043798711 /DNA_START=71 /DNA_END=1783 /DNA_ORIENTATION=-